MFPSGERYPGRSVIGEEDITDAHVVLWEMGDTTPQHCGRSIQFLCTYSVCSKLYLTALLTISMSPRHNTYQPCSLNRCSVSMWSSK